MNGSTTKVFASWKRVMTRGTYNLMLKRLSLCLLQARVRSFELYGFHTTIELRRSDRHAMHPLEGKRIKRSARGRVDLLSQRFE
jgi:hypothetical protein